jgi:hypothetical protein
MSPTVKAVDKVPYNQDAPSVVESEVSSISSLPEVPAYIRTAPKRKPLQWEFKGLTLWLEFEEFDGDLSKANGFLSTTYGTEAIPAVHATAIYGMEHLTEEEARKRLEKVPLVLPGGKWPIMDRPVAIKQDVSQEGLPGQVCSVAWAELTLKTNSEHEKALDAVCKLFDMSRGGPWTPHISLAYDNPQDSVLQLADIVGYALQMPSLLQNPRRVKAISLWSTVGKLSQWNCLGRVSLLDSE